MTSTHSSDARKPQAATTGRGSRYRRFVVVDPSANSEPYQHWEQLRGVWGRVQESPAYGILACMVGQFVGFTFEGRSGVYAPLEMTPAGDGILAEAKTVDQGEVILADLHLEALRRFRAERSPDFNLALVERYFPDVYEEHRLREAVMSWQRI